MENKIADSYLGVFAIVQTLQHIATFLNKTLNEIVICLTKLIEIFVQSLSLRYSLNNCEICK